MFRIIYKHKNLITAHKKPVIQDDKAVFKLQKTEFYWTI